MIILSCATRRRSANRASIYVYVPDVDSAYEIALSMAPICRCTADKPYPERRGVKMGLEIPGGFNVSCFVDELKPRKP